MDQSVKIRVKDIYAKATFNKKKNFHQQIGLKCEMLHLQHSLVMYWNLVTSGKKKSEITWHFWNVLLEKREEDNLDKSCEKLRSIKWSHA